MNADSRQEEELTGDALARACAAAMWAGDRASRKLGMEIVDVGQGRATLRMVIGDDMVNGLDIGHGGFVFTLADSAFAFACNSRNNRTVAQHCAISFLGPARKGDVLTAEAREVHRSGRTGIYDIRVTRADGEIVAEFRGHSRMVKGTHLPVAD